MTDRTPSLPTAGAADKLTPGAPGSGPLTDPLLGALFVHSVASQPRAAPAWLVEEPYEDHQRGTLKSGKEAEVFLVERRFASHTALLAHKRYRPRYPARGGFRALGLL